MSRLTRAAAFDCLAEHKAVPRHASFGTVSVHTWLNRPSTQKKHRNSLKVIPKK